MQIDLTILISTTIGALSSILTTFVIQIVPERSKRQEQKQLYLLQEKNAKRFIFYELSINILALKQLESGISEYCIGNPSEEKRETYPLMSVYPNFNIKTELWDENKKYLSKDPDWMLLSKAYAHACSLDGQTYIVYKDLISAIRFAEEIISKYEKEL